MDNNMKEDLAKISGIIPDLFYDIIARITAGIIFGIGLFYLMIVQKDGKFTVFQDWNMLFNSLSVFLLFIFIAYIIGFLISIFSIAYQNLFNNGFNPAEDLILTNVKMSYKKGLFVLIELILGLPFSLFFIKSYFNRFENSFDIKLKSLIDKDFSGIGGSRLIILCRDYIRSANREFGSILTKRQAESNMCRSIAIVMLLLVIYTIINGLWDYLLVEWLIFALSTFAYSYTRRSFAGAIYNYFFLLKNTGN